MRLAAVALTEAAFFKIYFPAHASLNNSVPEMFVFHEVTTTGKGKVPLQLNLDAKNTQIL